MANSDRRLEREKLQALQIAMQVYEMKLDLLSNATVVERAVHFVEKHKSRMQNQEVMDSGKFTTEPFQDRVPIKTSSSTNSQ